MSWMLGRLTSSIWSSKAKDNNTENINNINESAEHEHIDTTPSLASVEQYLVALEHCQLDAQFFLRPAQVTYHEFDLLSHSSTASALLKANDALSAWRYRLVPSKINEYTFWKNTFYQLDQYIDNATSHVEEGNGESNDSNQEDELAIFTTDDLNSQPSSVTDSQIPAQPNNQPNVLPDLERVRELEAQVMKLENEISQLRKQLSSARKTCSRCNQSVDPNIPSSCHVHTGVWHPDQGTLDFLALDDELKSNLRREKQKRLNAVKFEMRWIADTDEATSGSGSWSCCKQDYPSEGCSNQPSHTTI